MSEKFVSALDWQSNFERSGKTTKELFEDIQKLTQGVEVDLDLTLEEQCDEEPEYDSPHGSEWIVAVDISGSVTILDAPNIHYSFFDNGLSAEYIGLPFECEDLGPGIYKWVCDVHGGRDEFTGEYWGPEFSVREQTLLWGLNENLDR